MLKIKKEGGWRRSTTPKIEEEGMQGTDERAVAEERAVARKEVITPVEFMDTDVIAKTPDSLESIMSKPQRQNESVH